MRIPDSEWIWLLALVPLLAYFGWTWFVAIGRLRRATSLTVRGAIIVVLSLALAGAANVRSSDQLAVVMVIDVSGSVTRLGDTLGQMPSWVDRARAFVSESAASRGADDLVGVVLFDGRAVAVSTPSRGDVGSRTFTSAGEDGTDLGGAIELAAGMIPPDASGRLVLVSDGNETRGDIERSVDRISRSLGEGSQIPIDVVPLSYRVSRETLIESVDTPPRAAVDAPITVRIVLSSTNGSRGSLSLFREGAPLDINGDAPGLSRRIEVPPGRHAVLLEVPLDGSRLHRFEAVFTPDSDGSTINGDTFVQNNRGRSFTVTDGSGAVLILDGVGGGAPTGPGTLLADALREQGLEVNLVAPEAAPRELLGYQPYDAIILQNVPADEIAESAQNAMDRHVRELGAGLIMIGGRASFGAGGWKGTPVEELLPLQMDLPERMVVAETAIVLILDSSGSMSAPVSGSTRSQQEVANSAAASAVQSMDEADLVGVIEFASSATWVRPLGPNVKPEQTAELIGDINSDGGTNLLPAMELAREALSGVDAKVRHIIVLSDGRSKGEDLLPGIAEQLANEGINVSTIAVGDGADRGTMGKMAEVGGGVFYDVTNPSVLPRVFLKAVRVIRAPLIREVPFVPVLDRDADVLASGLGSFPPLGGLTLTQHLEDDSRVTRVLSTPEGEPLLVYWPVELGRVAAFTSDTWVWADEWIGWPGYAELWGRLVRSMLRPASDGVGRVETVVDERGRLNVSLSARTGDGEPLDLLRVPVSVFAPDGTTTQLTLEQVGPGEYRATTDADQPGTYIAVAKPSEGERRLTPSLSGASVPVGNEYRQLVSNTALLERVATKTGGRVLSLDAIDPGLLFDRSGIEPRRAEQPLWRTLVLIGLVLFVLDVGARRVAWDRLLGGIRDAGMVDAGASLSVLKGRSRQPAVSLGGEVEGLTEADAARLASEAKLQRRKRRLDAARQASRQSGASDQAAEQQDAPKVIDTTKQDQESGLLAAKRRASRRYEQDP